MGFELVLELHKARPRQGWRLLAPLSQTDAAGVRAWTATSGLAAALGPVVGGLLVTASWR